MKKPLKAPIPNEFESMDPAEATMVQVPVWAAAGRAARTRRAARKNRLRVAMLGSFQENLRIRRF